MVPAGRSAADGDVLFLWPPPTGAIHQFLDAFVTIHDLGESFVGANRLTSRIDTCPGDGVGADLDRLVQLCECVIEFAKRTCTAAVS